MRTYLRRYPPQEKNLQFWLFSANFYSIISENFLACNFRKFFFRRAHTGAAGVKNAHFLAKKRWTRYLNQFNSDWPAIFSMCSSRYYLRTEESFFWKIIFLLRYSNFSDFSVKCNKCNTKILKKKAFFQKKLLSIRR